jgi:hypothetical protein
VIAGILSAPIGEFENTLSFPSEETSIDSGLPSYLPLGDIPCPSSPPYGFLHHTFGALNNALCSHAITEIKMLTFRKKISTNGVFYGKDIRRREQMKQIAMKKILFLIIIMGLFLAGCSLFKNPVVIPPIFQEDFSNFDPEEFPEKIRQLEDIAQNHESMSIRTEAHFYIALAHIHYRNPSPDYSAAIKNLDEYIALNPENERIDEIVIWISVLRDLDDSIREYNELEKKYELLKQENVRANKDRKYLSQEKEELSKSLEKQKKQILSLEEKIKKLDSLYLEIEKKKKKKKG